jgi:hypothetical protein
VELHDNRTVTALRQLSTLVIQIEDMPSSSIPKEYAEEIQVIKAHFDFLSEHIFEQMLDEDNAENNLTNAQLLEITATKLQIVLEKMSKGGQQQQDEEHDKNPEAVTSFSSTCPSSSFSISETKRDLSEYMTEWLRDNWINPYPDDSGLEYISQVCGTTPMVVSNWLINARTRKWRPAIVKACDEGCPSGLLLDYSLAIFDGKPTPNLDIFRTVTASSSEEHDDNDNDNNEDDEDSESLPISKRRKRSRSASPSMFLL